ncbi:YkoF family thiamine/hydroxymethylpyrimidine-binding protein [Georgenia sp. Z1344]|uniref:YkoF family thiamine/hydroxymethylpyrimidine-binding protein n=1 Tax=Georgenia sp. Z1344 TaxID=3416706 RepID=UPI003CF6F098
MSTHAGRTQALDDAQVDPRTAAGTGSADPTPEQLGIGMRLSIHPHADDFVDVILGSITDVEQRGLTDGLVVESDAVSTYVGARRAPAEQRLAAYAVALVEAASRRTGGGHVVAHLLLSRGCPGEVTCDPRSFVEATDPAAPIELEPTGIPARAQWSLYPLLDGSSAGGDHMEPIMAAITEAQERGVASEAAHYATMLTGDLGEVVATATDAWARVGASVPHVVTHLTVSVGSPSEQVAS